MSNRPIGIFDSGVGGLTVCKSINRLLPSEKVIYFGDTARFPYGTRSNETIVRYAREICFYLLSRNVKMIIVACNTASAAALDILRKEIDVPMIGVIEAGARAACKRVAGDIIGVIGTRATVNSNAYVKAIHTIDSDVKILQQQATLFVPLTEEGMFEHEIAYLAVREYIEDMFNKGVRTLILGCTHFPMMKKAIHTVYPDIDLVDTGEEVACEVKAILEKKNLENNVDSVNKGNIELYASDITSTMKKLKVLFFGENNIEIKKLVING